MTSNTIGRPRRKAWGRGRSKRLRESRSNRALRQLTGVGFVLSCFLPLIIETLVPENLARSQVYLGAVILILGLLPSILYLRQPQRPPFPFLPLVGVFYIASCGLPALYDVSSTKSQFTQVSIDALLVVICGLISLYAVYYTVSATAVRLVSPVIFVPVSGYDRVRLGAWCLLIVHLLALFLPSFVRALYITEFTNTAGYVSSGLMLILWLRRRLGQVELLLVTCVAVPIEFLFRLASGSVAQLFMLVLFLLTIQWIERRTVPWLVVVSGIAAFFVLNDAKVEYRRLTWFNGTYGNASILTKAQLFMRLASNEAGEAKVPDHGRRVLETGISRLSQLGFLTYVVQQTPSTVPYWRGETYANLVYKLIPRALWKSKPTEQMGVEFSRRYGMRADADETTSFNVPWLVEMYANFGWSGVIGGMSVVGALFAYMEKKLNAPGMSMAERVVGAALLIDLIAQESNFSLMIGAKLLTFLTFSSFFRLVLGAESTLKHGCGIHVRTSDIWAKPELSDAMTKPSCY